MWPPSSEFWASLGVAGPLVAILLYLLRQATDERRQITDAFLNALMSTVQVSNEARVRSASELSNLSQSIREQTSRASEEHSRVIDAIGKMILREHA